MDQNVYIWDLDGTLLDSYKVIVTNLQDAARDFGFEYEREVINRCVIMYTIDAFYEMVRQEHGLAPEVLSLRYRELNKERMDAIQTVDGAYETLEKLKTNGSRHFVYTHRGVTAVPVLNRLGLTKFFDEIVTLEYGLARKPAPDGINYLIEKYGLNRSCCYYVGDRTIDMDCAKNAGIAGILYLPEDSYCEPNGSETRIVKDLREI